MHCANPDSIEPDTAARSTSRSNGRARRVSCRTTTWIQPSGTFPLSTRRRGHFHLRQGGTTWTQQIVGQLIFGGRPDVDVAAAFARWVDLRVPPKGEARGARARTIIRRFIKTHLPVEALVFSPAAKYSYIGRDGRDVVWSFYNHHSSGNEAFYRGAQRYAGPRGPSRSRLRPPSAPTFSTGCAATDFRSGRCG